MTTRDLRLLASAGGMALAIAAGAATADPAPLAGYPVQIYQLDGILYSQTGGTAAGNVSIGAGPELASSTVTLGVDPGVETHFASDKAYGIESIAEITYSLEYKVAHLPANPPAATVGFAANDVIVEGGPAASNDTLQAYVTIQAPDSSYVFGAGECFYGAPSACSNDTGVTVNAPLSTIASVTLTPNVVYTVSVYAEAGGGGDGFADAKVDPEFSVLPGQPGEILASPEVAGPAPEPAAWAMLLAGFGLVGAIVRRRRGAKPAAAAIT